MNRDYIILLYNLVTDETEEIRVHTLKELNDKFESMPGRIITSIIEIAGDPRLDKYYKNHKEVEA